jgi:ferredoxin--NADP+ reductase
MKFLAIASHLALLASTADAFSLGQGTKTNTKTRTASSSSSSSSTTSLNYEAQKVGGGIAAVAAGDRLLFDPADEGMLGGTHSLNDRLESGTTFVYLPVSSSSSSSPPADATVARSDTWLEHLSQEIPPAFAKASSPVLATVLGRGKLIDDAAPGDIEHVVMRLPEGFHYIEGQSLSVIPPGADAKTGKSNKPRLYSIASTRYGDLLDGNTVSLCVRRAEYYDPITGTVDPTKAGVCSNFLCDVSPGTQVQVAGPVGKTMLLPEDPTQDIIMVATGTGIAPFRGFLHRLFVEETTAKHMFQGQAWLILGVPVTGGLLYAKEFDAMTESAAEPDSLRIDYAISREMTNARGGKLYVQDVLSQHADELFAKLENGAHIYFCGLKGMMPGILDALEQVATTKGMDWKTKLSEYKSNKQWHVEVY